MASCYSCSKCYAINQFNCICHLFKAEYYDEKVCNNPSSRRTTLEGIQLYLNRLKAKLTCHYNALSSAQVEITHRISSLFESQKENDSFLLDKIDQDIDKVSQLLTEESYEHIDYISDTDSLYLNESFKTYDEPSPINLKSILTELQLQLGLYQPEGLSQLYSEICPIPDRQDLNTHILKLKEDFNQLITTKQAREYELISKINNLEAQHHHSFLQILKLDPSLLPRLNYSILKSINLNSHNIGLNEIDALSRSQLHNLTHLSLSRNSLGSLEIEALTRFKFIKLEILNLDNNNIGTEGVYALSRWNLPRLKRLHLGSCGIKAAGVEGMAKCYFPLLEGLYLSGNDIRNEGVKFLFKLEFPKLDALVLSYNNIDSIELETISGCRFSKLSYLCIKGNHLDSDTIRSLQDHFQNTFIDT